MDDTSVISLLIPPRTKFGIILIFPSYTETGVSPQPLNIDTVFIPGANVLLLDNSSGLISTGHWTIVLESTLHMVYSSGAYPIETHQESVLDMKLAPKKCNGIVVTRVLFSSFTKLLSKAFCRVIVEGSMKYTEYLELESELTRPLPNLLAAIKLFITSTDDICHDEAIFIWVFATERISASLEIPPRSMLLFMAENT